MSDSTHWHSRPEGGNRFALWLIRAIALYGGRRLGRLCLYPVTLYFYLRRGPERRASRQYLERALASPVRPWQILRHFYYYAATTLDRIFLLTHGEKSFVFETEGLDLLDRCVAQGRGVLLLGSHQGSFEALRALGARCPDLSLRVVLDKQKTPAMTEMLEALAPQVGASVIDAAQDGTSIALAMAEACQQGAVLAMLADRGRDHEVLRKAPFLGRPAPFPVSPWLLAHTLKVPVVLCFGLYMGGNRYRLIFEAMADQVHIPRHRRGEALDEWVSRYAQRVEHYVHVMPYNWFNFYDFWQQGNVVAGQPDAVLVGEHVGVSTIWQLLPTGYHHTRCAAGIPFQWSGVPMLPQNDWAHLIPHAGNMCLLDEVRHWDETTIHASSCGHTRADNPLRGRAGLHAVHLAEYGAQAMAVHAALRGRATGMETVRQGRLVSLRDMHLRVEYVDRLKGRLDVHAECFYADPSGAQYGFRIEHRGQVLATGRVAVIHTGEGA